MKSAIVVGASSGLGRSLALALARDGYRVGLVARRTERLAKLRDEIGEHAVARSADAADPQDIRKTLTAMIEDWREVDLIVLAAAVSHWNPELEWEPQAAEIDTNARGFAAAATVAMDHFRRIGHGHLVGISSVAGIRGSRNMVSYAASKAFVSTYLDGLRSLAVSLRLPICVTEIQPGFMDSGTAHGKIFWSVSLEKAAELALRAIRRRTKHVYITSRWRLIAIFMRYAPDCLWNRCQ